MKKKKTPAINESFASENSAFQEIGERQWSIQAKNEEKTYDSRIVNITMKSKIKKITLKVNFMILPLRNK